MRKRRKSRRKRRKVKRKNRRKKWRKNKRKRRRRGTGWDLIAVSDLHRFLTATRKFPTLALAFALHE